MPHLLVERHDHVTLIRMARGKANALNEAMVDELHEAIARADADADVRGLVLASASPRLFSGGFDVTEVFRYDDDRMRRFFGRFLDLLDAIRLLPKPVIAAIGGHAYAGGALIAIVCDFRIMSDHDCCFAVNEVNLGVVLPRQFIAALGHALGPKVTRRMLMAGDVFHSTEALSAGIADELVVPSAVIERAVARARELGAKPPIAFAAHKRALAGTHGEPHSYVERQEALDEFMGFWTGDESRRQRQALLETLEKKSS